MILLLQLILLPRCLSRSLSFYISLLLYDPFPATGYASLAGAHSEQGTATSLCQNTKREKPSVRRLQREAEGEGRLLFYLSLLIS